MLFVKSKEYNDRLSICRACKFFESSTQSCGPLIVGEEVETEVLFKKKSIRLCGCVMPVKAKLSFANCPAKKWKQPLTLAEQKELKLFLLGLKERNKVEAHELTKLYQYKDIVTGAHNERTTCGACVKKDINTFLESLKDIDIV